MGLNSSSVIKIVDLLCEGPIDGIEGNKKGVFLDESPIQAQDGEIFLEADQVSHELGLDQKVKITYRRQKARRAILSALTRRLAQNTKRI